MTPCDGSRTFETVRQVDLLRHPGFIGKPLHVDEEGKHHIEVGGLGKPRVGWKVSRMSLLIRERAGSFMVAGLIEG